MKTFHNTIRILRWVLFGVVLALFTTIIGGFLGMILLGAVDLIISFVMGALCYNKWKPLLKHLIIYWLGATIVILALVLSTQNHIEFDGQWVYVAFPISAMSLSAYLGWMTEKLKQAGMLKALTENHENEELINHEA